MSSLNVIIIGTIDGRGHWFESCFNSVKDSSYPIIKCDCGGYELGKIDWVVRNTNYNQFIFIQDSIVVKDTSIFKKAFDLKESVAFGTYPTLYGSYFGKYKSEIVKKCHYTIPQTKMQAVEMEQKFNRQYCLLDDVKVFEPLVDSKEFVEKFGAKRMKLENSYFIKYKTYWHRGMIND